MATKKATPGWSDVKTKLADFDRAGLIGLVQDLYAASKDNQPFFHARFALGDDVLKPYKATIDRWPWPEVQQSGHVSRQGQEGDCGLQKGYRSTRGSSGANGFYCERAAGFGNDIGLQDERYFDALVRMFEQALKTMDALPDGRRQALVDRLDLVRSISHDFGYGVGDDMDKLLSEHGVDD